MLAGVEIPGIEGRGEDPDEEEGTSTSSERHAPRPETTLDPLLQLAATQVPPRRTWLELEQARQLFGPEPEQLAQLPSHDWHVDEVVSKYWFWLQVARQRPFVGTGRFLLQLVH